MGFTWGTISWYLIVAAFSCLLLFLVFPKLQTCKSVELGDQIICWFCGTCEDDIVENIPRLAGGCEESLKRFIAYVCVRKTGQFSELIMGCHHATRKWWLAEVSGHLESGQSHVLSWATVRVVSSGFLSREDYLSTFCLLTCSRISGVVFVQPDAVLNFSHT